MVKPFDDALREIQARERVNPLLLDEFRWLLEEYRISIFAQELGTSQAVSPQKLKNLLDQIETEG